MNWSITFFLVENICNSNYNIISLFAIDIFQFSSFQSLSCVQLCDPMDYSKPGLPVHHQLPEFTQTHVH